MFLYDIKVENMKGETKVLSKYKGTVLLIVNTASKCGFTKQFGPLEQLNVKYKKDNFEVLGFPCNQFLRQDPGTNKEILEFCSLNFGVTFEMFKKINVKGKDIHPLYEYLVNNSPANQGKKIRWNFEKFLISSTGEIINRYQSKIIPEAIDEDILKLLDN